MDTDIRVKALARQGNYNPRHAPDDLKALTQWVVWRYAERNGKITKLPINPRYSGRMARTNDPTTWSTFDHASRVCGENPKLTGVGFVFSGDDPYVGIDLDNCRDPETGVIDPWAAAWIRRLGGYAEVSPSGSGVKIISKGSLPSSVGKTIVDGHEVEIYDRGRFFTITGWRLAGSTDPEDSQEAIEELHALMRAAKPATKPALRREGGGKRAVEGPIPEGMRHATIRSILGSLHDGARTLEDLIRVAYKINAERCQPPIGSTPDDDQISDLQDMAKWIFSKEPCKPSRDPEVGRVAGELWAGWWRTLVRGGGRSKVRDSARALIENGQRHGDVVEVVVNGEKRTALSSSLSARQGSELAGTSHTSFARAMRKLIEAGMAIVGGEWRDGEGRTYYLLAPRTSVTPYPSPPLDWGVTPSRPPADTPIFEWRHPVGNARSGTLSAVEVHGPKTAEELAGIMGSSRPRDFRRRHLDVLVERGDLIIRDDGRYACPEDYAERMDDELNKGYVAWRRRRTTVDRGRVVKWVESGEELSDVERLERKKERHRLQRENYRKRPKMSAQDPTNSPEEQLAVPKNLVPVHDGFDSEPQDYDHPPGCPCVTCEYERLRESA